MRAPDPGNPEPLLLTVPEATSVLTCARILVDIRRGEGVASRLDTVVARTATRHQRIGTTTPTLPRTIVWYALRRPTTTSPSG